jgi:hypothetical protein
VHVGGQSLVAELAVRPPSFLHSTFVDVSLPVEMVYFELPHQHRGKPVVELVELIDDLKGPSTIQNVPPHELRLYQLRRFLEPSGLQHLDGFTKHQVGMAHELMKVVEVSAGALHVLHGLRGFANCGNSVVVECIYCGYLQVRALSSPSNSVRPWCASFLSGG